MRRRVASTRYILCASPYYLKKNDVPTHPIDLIRHDYITHSLRKPDHVVSFKDGKDIHVNPTLWLNDSYVMRECAIRDMGIVNLHDYMVVDAIKEGKLIEILREYQEPQKNIYLMIAFAITPGLGVMIGGYLSSHFAWTSTFYASALYGVILLLLATKLPETKKELDFDALKIDHLIKGYLAQFKNLQLIAGGLLMGGATCFVYVFAALAPFIAMNKMHMSVATYGIANLLPPIGLVLGSLVSAKLAKIGKPTFIITLGIIIALIGSIVMLILILIKSSALFALFVPMMLCYFGLALVFANASAIAMRNTSDKAHGSAVMNFINMGLVTLIVLSMSAISIYSFLLPAIYIGICIFMMLIHLIDGSPPARG